MPSKPDIYRDIRAIQLQANVALQVLQIVPAGSDGPEKKTLGAALDYLQKLLEIRRPER